MLGILKQVNANNYTINLEEKYLRNINLKSKRNFLFAVNIFDSFDLLTSASLVCLSGGRVSSSGGSKPPHPHHPALMVHPHHPLLATPTSSLEALRAHAQAAAMQSPVPLQASHGTDYLPSLQSNSFSCH